MAGVASKNPFELLGNDSDADAPAPPTKAIDKTGPRVGKRNAVNDEPPRGGSNTSSRGRSTGGPRGASGNEAAFRDRGAGHDQNRSRTTEDREGGRGRGRGGRGRGRGGPPRDDRHSKTGVTDHEKQVGHGWGANTGDAELADETAGADIAKAEEKDAEAEDAEGANGEPVDEGPKTKSYEDYLAEQAEKKLHLGDGLSARKANEGSKKKFPEGKEVARDEEEENFFIGGGGKNKRERQKKEKAFVELDGDRMRQTDNERRGGGRGGRGRGEFRGGDRGDFGGRGGDRPERGERGDFGGRGRGGRGRGEFRGEGGRGRGRGGRGNAPNVSDQSAFPTLGS